LSVTQQQVLDALAGVRSPRGVALTNADVLSPITVGDGKVFFSINVDAAEARAWETVRAQAESAVRAIPGVESAMIALTAERKAGSPAPPPQRHGPGDSPNHAQGPAPSHAPGQRQGVAPVASHRPPPNPTGSPMARQSEIPGVAAVIAVASGKGGVGSRPPRSIWRWACAISACGSACWMPTSTDRRCPG
jgi:ATP-binding protein involved in chromosome partitioning